jgi:phenylacetic acid degradation operon negative regulatory protein
MAWRLVCFDVPMAENRRRRHLRRYLRGAGLGLLQHSIWIAPHPLDEESRLLAGVRPDVRSLTLFEGRSCGGESDRDIVAAAWDFGRINERYQHYLKILANMPRQKVRERGHATRMLTWAQAEHTAWTRAVTADPLLPKALLPREYLGKRAWKRRNQAVKKAARLLHEFEGGSERDL